MFTIVVKMIFRVNECIRYGKIKSLNAIIWTLKTFSKWEMKWTIVTHCMQNVKFFQYFSSYILFMHTTLHIWNGDNWKTTYKIFAQVKKTNSLFFKNKSKRRKKKNGLTLDYFIFCFHHRHVLFKIFKPFWLFLVVVNKCSAITFPIKNPSKSSESIHRSLHLTKSLTTSI